MDAKQVLEAAKAQGVKGVFLKRFGNGQVLCEYTVKNAAGVAQTFKVRAFLEQQVAQ